MGKAAARYAVWFMAVLAAFVLLMTLAHCIPNSMVAYHQETSKTILSMESEWLWFGNFFGVDAGRLDNTTDNIMVDGVIIQDDGMSPLQAAMSVNGYSRYWHGYLVFLRPLMIWLNYWQIRYVNMFVFFLLVCAVFRLIGKRVGAGGSVFVCGSPDRLLYRHHSGVDAVYLRFPGDAVLDGLYADQI